MEMTDEAPAADGTGRAKEPALRETWLPPAAEDTAREFEEYLMEIGIRF